MALGNYETIKKRFVKAYVRDDQLHRYWELGALTDEQYIEIFQLKYPDQYPEGLEQSDKGSNNTEEEVTDDGIQKS